MSISEIQSLMDEHKTDIPEGLYLKLCGLTKKVHEKKSSLYKFNIMTVTNYMINNCYDTNQIKMDETYSSHILDVSTITNPYFKIDELINRVEEKGAYESFHISKLMNENETVFIRCETLKGKCECLKCVECDECDAPIHDCPCDDVDDQQHKVEICYRRTCKHFILNISKVE